MNILDKDKLKSAGYGPFPGLQRLPKVQKYCDPEIKSFSSPENILSLNFADLSMLTPEIAHKARRANN